MSKTTNNREKELREIEKIHEYLEARKEIFDFLLRRKVLCITLAYLGIGSAVALLGAGAFIDHRVKGKVERRLSEMIDEEYTYLSERNTITELGDTAISTQDVKYYEDLKGYLSSKQPQRIRTAAKAELLRITSYLSTWDYHPFDPDNTKAHEMSADQLHELYLETDSIAQKMAALFFLRYRFNKETPDFLLDIAKSTKNLVRSLGTPYLFLTYLSLTIRSDGRLYEKDLSYCVLQGGRQERVGCDASRRLPENIQMVRNIAPYTTVVQPRRAPRYTKSQQKSFLTFSSWPFVPFVVNTDYI